jgi:uncharacterized protein (DUF4415 family)
MRRQSKTNWNRVDALRDVDIDLSDSPELEPSFFAKAVRWPGRKQPISLRLDPDVLEFFRKQGRGYQSTINTLLRRYMEAHEEAEQSRASHRHRGGPQRAHGKLLSRSRK